MLFFEGTSFWPASLNLYSLNFYRNAGEAACKNLTQAQERGWGSGTPVEWVGARNLHEQRGYPVE